MNKKQKLILKIGCFLLLIHLVFYFSNVHSKYKKLQLTKANLESNYSQSNLMAVKEKEGSFRKVLLAWVAVSLFLGFGTSLLMRFFKGNPLLKE